MATPTAKGPQLSRAESKADATSRVALSIVERERASQQAKTERLRNARMAQESLPTNTPPAPKSGRSKTI